MRKRKKPVEEEGIDMRTAVTLELLNTPGSDILLLIPAAIVTSSSVRNRLVQTAEA